MLRQEGEQLCLVGINSLELLPIPRQICIPINPSSDAFALVASLGLKAVRFVLVLDYINSVGTVQLAPDIRKKDLHCSRHNRQMFLQLMALGN